MTPRAATALLLASAAAACSPRDDVAPRPSGPARLVVAFTGEELPPDAEWAEKKAGLLKGLAERKKNAMLEAFLADRRQSAKVVVHPEALK